ncbi:MULTISPECIES: NfeD family protein [Aeromonas]|uniref:NfeD family protein n=1 Tax=Aeromonas veronii TaxID=654 RepID=A0A4V3Z016_AERVE|nr:MULTISPECIES: NfeD family protein [Aeromonas]THJ44942.1 NfeD family protein [Aeromonas veronii]
MMALFEGLTHWHWLGLGFILLAIEVLGSVGFLLWTGIAALEVGLLLLIWPFGWQAQLLLFAVQSLLTTWAWWRWQHQHDNSGHDAACTINERMKGYAGRQLVLLDNVDQGVSRVRLDDTVWMVRCNEPLSAGDKIIVVGADSHILLVEPAS